MMKKNLTNSTEVTKNQVTVYTTRNYDLFKSIKRNRPINDSHVAKLSESMSREMLFSPITVNENGEVIDGQHRLAACKQARLPVSYVIVSGYNINEIMSYNKFLKAWSTQDFIDSYAEAGIESYRLLNRLMVRHKLTPTIASIFLGRAPNDTKNSIGALIKSGKYQTTRNYDDAFAMGKMLNEILALANELGCKIHKTSLCYIVKEFYYNPNYDHKRMLHKLSIYRGDIELASSIRKTHLKIWLNDVYNFMSKTRQSLVE